MNLLATIFRKELIDTLRDRRTIITMVLIPLLLFPVIMNVMTRIQMSQVKKAREQVLKVALISHGNAAAFRQSLLARDDVKLREDLPLDSVRAWIQHDSLDGAFVFDERFDERVHGMKSGRVKFYYKSTENERQDITKRRLRDLLDAYEKTLLADRFKALQLDESVVEPIKVTEVNVATQKERLGKMIGGFLPYIFVLFCFMGSMYPAIDLAAGEKERGTIETLLTAPVSRLQILLGKFGVVVLTGIASAAISLVGLYVGFRQMPEVPSDALEAILGILEVKSIVLVLTLLLPLTVFFAGVLLSLSIFARSFKEAQSLISPMTIVVILPVVVGLLPGMELNAKTALIPVLNVSLATKEIIAGTARWGLLAEVYASLILLAAAGLLLSARMFSRESVIFRT